MIHECEEMKKRYEEPCFDSEIEKDCNSGQWYLYVDGKGDYYHKEEKITYCPFCGEKLPRRVKDG